MKTQAPSRRGAKYTISTRLRPVLAGCCISLALAAHGDAVITWNETADATSVFAGAPPFRNRITAMAQVAVHDALNSIAPRYESYADIPRAAEGASIDAAVAAAAYRVLVQTVPSRAPQLALAYTNWIDALPDCPPAAPTCIEDGVAAGEAAAQAIIAIRTGDGSATPHLPYTLPAGPGVYQPTPPAFAAPQFAGWAKLEPFGIFTQDQFRMDPSRIFDLTSDEYTRDFSGPAA